MTRNELATNLAAVLAPYSIPVVAYPHQAVLAPAVIVDAGSPYRQRQTMCWSKTWSLTVVAGRQDDAYVDDTADELADTLIRVLEPFADGGVVNQGVASPPATQTIGDVDYLAFTFTLTDHNLGPGREEC